MAFTYLKFSDSLTAGATLTPTTEDASYPIENVQTEPVSEVYRTTDVAAQKSLIQYAAPVTADIFAIVNHNFTSAAAITLRGGSSPDPDGGEFETVIASQRRTAWKVFTEQTWQYWSLTVDDPTNTDLILEIGLLLMGEKVTLARAFDYGVEQRRETLNQVLESEYGVVTVGPNLFQRTRLTASWKTIDAAQRSEMDEFLAGLERERHGMLFIPFPDESEAFYGRFFSDYSLIRVSPEVTEIPALEFLEDSVGRAIFA